MNFRLRAAGLFAVIGLGAVGCDEILGIEDAQVDPTLGGAGQRSSGGAGNNTGVGGKVDPMSGGAVAAGGTAGTTAQSGGTSGGLGPAESGGTGAAEGGRVATGSGGALIGEAGAGGGDSDPPTLCERYCDVMGELCVGDAIQYGDKSQCLKVCELFPQGVIGGADGNTVACRLRHAEKARYGAGTERNAYCRQAGPGGNGTCGSNCDGFCTIMTATCTATVIEAYSYSSSAACQSDCASVPDPIPFQYGADSVADGNSVGCRLFHVMSAVMADAEEHCAHARGTTLCEGTSPNP